MSYTISLHTEGDAMVVSHNRRDAVTLKESHIDHSLPHETWIDRDLVDFYKDTFTSAVEDFNKRERHLERRIDNYYAEVKNNNKQHLVYESIIQVGNADMQPTEDVCRDVLKTYLDEFIRDNPTMEVVGAYYHADEPNGTPHLHLDYVPVARDCKRGLSVQNSHGKAVEQLGIEQGHYKNLTHAFQERERDRLERICKEHNLDIERGVCADRRRHKEKELYILDQRTEKALDVIKDLEIVQNADRLNIRTLKDIIARQEAQDARQKELDDRDSAFEEHRAKFNKYVHTKTQELQKAATELSERSYRTIDEEAQQIYDKQLADRYRALQAHFPAQMQQLERAIGITQDVQIDHDLTR